MIFVGVDWAEAHHDVHVADVEGKRLAKARLPEGVEGIARFHELVNTHAEGPADVVVGIETDRGLFVTALVAAGYQLYAVNPMSTSATGTVTRRVGPSPTPVMPRCSPTWCAPTATTTAWWRETQRCRSDKGAGRAHQSMVWSRGARRTCCAPPCGSSTPQPWPPSMTWPTPTP